MNTQIKTTWRKVKLGDVANVLPGFAFKSSEFKKDGDIPVIKIKNITDDLNVSMENGEYLDESALNEKTKKYLISNSDILVAMTGATAGKVGKFRSNKKALLNQRVAKISPKNIDANFLWILLGNKDAINLLYRLADGAAQPNMSGGQIENLEFRIPARIEDQKQIADVLSAYDDLIENNTKRIKILEQIAQAIYKEWFVSPVNGGNLPNGWKNVALRDAIESYIGGGWGKEEPDDNYPSPAYVIRGTDIPNAAMGNISTCPLRYHKPSNLRVRVLQGGDLVFEVSGGSKGQPVGRSLLITTNLLGQFKQNVICASFCKLIRPNRSKISPFQLYEQILSWYENGVIEKYQVQSTGISNFKFESFIEEEKITLPPDGIREKFDHSISPLFDEIYSLGNQNQNLRQARDLLLPKLVSGEIKV
ncbi:MAG: restriction endonuclease subunit S [bacterium]|nr:restriction endonuclease subunit S [bacterium]